MSDAQDQAEQFDEDLLGDPLDDDGIELSDDAAFEMPADHPIGLQFADADVTDESFAERTEQEIPEET